ncbi:MAG: molybdenum cofactor guanylyltransferase [Rhodocyclaceae bacterium]|nr:molybdenum cofactor guanylyltransferase [Rhodocyclaceae bacterium]
MTQALDLSHTENGIVTSGGGSDRPGVTGLILAGGEGRRMGGADKGLLLFDNRPLARHTAERLWPQVDALLLSANRNLDAYRALGFEPLVDEVSDGARSAGPLAGMLSGLTRCTTPWMVSVPCDSPRFPADLVERLLAAARQADAPAVLAATDAGPHPVFMLLRRDLLPSLRSFVAGGGRRVREWQNAVGAATARFPDEAAFTNINTPDDLTRQGPA